MHTINWYPGHMAKARRMLEDNLKLVDMIIEIVDARAPMACRNPDFEALFKNKLRVVVLNKSDLSSKTQNRAWISYFAKRNGRRRSECRKIHFHQSYCGRGKSAGRRSSGRYAVKAMGQSFGLSRAS